MRLIDKFPKLRDKAFVKRMICSSVYGSMALEDQTVAIEIIEKQFDEVFRDYPNDRVILQPTPSFFS